ncbi:MAG TPA: transglutaminase-like domain-containing protein [Bacteroidales bacterium]|nr:transglutaminase-like domain-containing protein [Bacteroidales bacterium]
MRNYAVSGKTTTLKNYANVHDTIDAARRIVRENYPAVQDLAYSLEGNNCQETFQNIWSFVRQNIRYQNDEPGKEQLRTPQRTVHDQTGDCDDMSILISSILTNLEFNHELVVAAYKKENLWQHIYPVAYSIRGDRYVIDCVPEIPHFNYEAQPIKNKIVINMNSAYENNYSETRGIVGGLNDTYKNQINNIMKLEQLGSVSAEMISELTEDFDINNLSADLSEEDQLQAIQGILGNVAIVGPEDEYDTVISGSELQQNIILKQLMEAKQTLEKEISDPSEMSQLNDNQTELDLINEIILNFYDEEEREQAIQKAISKGTLYKNFYKAIQFGFDESINGLLGDSDEELYYLKVLSENGMLEELISDEYTEEDLEGLAAIKLNKNPKAPKSGGLLKKIGNKVKQGVQKFKENNPKIAKVGHALNKYNPATFTLRKSMEAFLRANVFNMAEKLAIGYASESEAKNLGYSTAEWKQFVDVKNKAEQKWHSLGGDKAYFKQMVMNGRGAKKAGLKGQLGLAPAIIAAITKVFGGIIELVKKLKLRRKDGSIVDETKELTTTNLITNKTKSMTTGTEKDASDGTSAENSANVQIDEKSGASVETQTDEEGKEIKVYRDKEGNEISRFKYFLIKNKTMIIIVSVVLTIGIAALVIWKVRQRSLRGLGEVGLSRKQENFIKRKGLNSRAYASLIREEIKKDKKPYNDVNRKSYYKKVFSDAFNRPLSTKQVSAAQNYNQMYSEVRKLAKSKGGGSSAWREAWAIVKKKR